MMALFGENDVKTVEDLAGCSGDDLLGYDDSKKGERFHVKGILEGTGISKEDAEAIVMAARVMMGWVEAEPEAAEEEAPAEAEEEA
jgi:N utilization substance protein A